MRVVEVKTGTHQRHDLALLVAHLPLPLRERPAPDARLLRLARQELVADAAQAVADLEVALELELDVGGEVAGERRGDVTGLRFHRGTRRLLVTAGRREER